MSELFDSLRLKNANEVELIISGKIVPIIVTNLEEECVSYEMKTKIKLTGIINCRSSAKKIMRSIAGMANSVFDMAYKKVIFNAPATIVIWKDGSKTVVTCQKGDKYDPEKGLALCFMKKALGNKGNFNNILKTELSESGE